MKNGIIFRAYLPMFRAFSNFTYQQIFLTTGHTITRGRWKRPMLNLFLGGQMAVEFQKDADSFKRRMHSISELQFPILRAIQNFTLPVGKRKDARPNTARIAEQLLRQAHELTELATAVYLAEMPPEMTEDELWTLPTLPSPKTKESFRPGTYKWESKRIAYTHIEIGQSNESGNMMMRLMNGTQHVGGMGACTVADAMQAVGIIYAENIESEKAWGIKGGTRQMSF